MTAPPTAGRRRGYSVLLAASLVTNVALLLWSASADEVARVSRTEFDAAVAAARAAGVESAKWSVVHVDSEQLGVLERGSMMSIRALLGGPPRREVLLFYPR